MRADPRALLLPVLALIPAFLGGATERWSQGVILILLGLLFLFRPPRVITGGPLGWMSLALFGCALAAFLPASWFGLPWWRIVATRDLGLDLGRCITPQPWLTLEACVLLTAGLLWFHYVRAEPLRFPNSSREYTRSVFRASFSTLGCGIALFAAVCLFLHWTKTPWPFANANYQFGPFPNRNQTGNLLAVGGILLLALAHDAFRNREKSWILWTSATVLVLAALVMAYSRGAIVLFFLAVIVWIAWLAAVRKSNARLAVGAGVVLILGSAFLFCGGETVDRFLPFRTGEGRTALMQDLRWKIQKDALTLGRRSPVTGIGLGNFESQFWLSHRALGTANFHVLHPESDWIWLRVEMGWLSVALVVAAGVVFALRIGPPGTDSSWRLRAAAVCAMSMFALHGAVDVSGHRLGTVFPALFLCGLAMRPSRRTHAASWGPSWGYRSAGCLFCGVGSLWLYAGWNNAMPVPGQIGVDCLKARIVQFNQSAAYDRAIDAATAALQWAPLDWELYEARAVAAALRSPHSTALTDFRRARYLNPVTPEIAFNEGAIWLARQPSLTLPAWQEALRRAGDSRPEFFGAMLSTAAGNAAVRAGLRECAEGDLGLTLLFMSRAPADEFQVGLTTLLCRDPTLSTLSAIQKRDLFNAWASKTNGAAFLAAVESHADWLRYAWPQVARFHAANGDFQGAIEVAIRFIAAPAPPEPNPLESIANLERDLYLNPQDITKGYSLCCAQKRAGDSGGALLTVQKFTARKGCPTLFYSLEATLLAAEKKWTQAWEAVQRGGLLDPAKPEKQ